MSVHILLVSAWMRDCASTVFMDPPKAPRRAGVFGKLVLSRDLCSLSLPLGTLGLYFVSKKKNKSKKRTAMKTSLRGCGLLYLAYPTPCLCIQPCGQRVYILRDPEVSRVVLPVPGSLLTPEPWFKLVRTCFFWTAPFSNFPVPLCPAGHFSSLLFFPSLIQNLLGI